MTFIISFDLVSFIVCLIVIFLLLFSAMIGLGLGGKTVDYYTYHQNKRLKKQNEILKDYLKKNDIDYKKIVSENWKE